MTDNGFTIIRHFAAPPDLVFEAWTDADYLGWFFNPGNPTSEPVTVDLRVGGHWRQMMVIDAEKRYFTGGVYREIVPGKRLVFNWGAVGGWPELRLEALEEAPLVVIEFIAEGAGTRMAFRLDLPQGYEDMGFGATLAEMQAGWSGTIDRQPGQVRERAVPA